MRKTILVVDDEEIERELLFQIFGRDYEVIMAKDGKEAILQLSRHSDRIKIILLDLVMPLLNGYQVLQVIKAGGNFSDIPIAMITSNKDTSLEVACYTMGVIAVIHKPFVAQVVRKQVENIMEMYENCSKLKETVFEETDRLNNFYDKLIDIMSNLIEFRNRDMEYGMHIRRIKGMTKVMLEGYINLFPESKLSTQYCEMVIRASSIHDIGKIAIPDQILLKPTALTDEEREIMKSHTTKGCEVLQNLSELNNDLNYQIAYNICRYHHERYDGGGYPDGLRGEDIPLCAQIVSIVDCYEALLSKRVYKQAYSKQTAYKMIVEGECGVFAPKIMQVFKHQIKKLEETANTL